MHRGRFQSTSSSVSQQSSPSLDLDFILNLLDSSQTKSASPTWSRMKYKEFKLGISDENVEAKTTKSSSISVNSFLDEDFGTVDLSSSSESTLSRLQSLADSLPTELFDRSQPPMSFFEIEASPSNILRNLSEEPVNFSPILKRDNVDWSTVTLTSILKKIVPEEVFMKTEEESKANLETIDIAREEINKSHQGKELIKFSLAELKLLDRVQLHSLAKLNSIPCDQTDHKIEQDLLIKIFRITPPKRVLSAKLAINRDKIPWTAENEASLLKLYEELRAEKQKLDQKLQSALEAQGNHAAFTDTLIKRGKGCSDRGFWAILADRFKYVCKYHVSVTECRNKLIILKRLKPSA